MNSKTLLAAVLAAGSLVGVASVAQATPAVVAGTAPYYGQPAPVYGQPAPVPYGGGYTVYSTVQAPPPAPIYEAVPAPRQGYLWAPGHYTWENGRYIWRGGEWMATRPGYGWQAAHWEQRGDGSWYLVAGTWVRTDNYAGYENNGQWAYRDRDGDGVINRDDRFPNDGRRW
jgi:hypothetical protein